MQNQLWFGNNLEVLRRHIPTASVDLIYLDPPFNSEVNYNVLFSTPDEHKPSAQAEAFRDTWWWGTEAEEALDDLIMRIGGGTAAIINALMQALGRSDMMAYLVMMAVRLHELRRVLKDDGTLYLHCDPTASHYLKIVLDGIFGPTNFDAEIIWKRTNSRSTKGKWPRLHDTLLVYKAGKGRFFEPQLVPGDLQKIPHTLIKKADGHKYQTYELTGPGVTKDGESGREWRGFNPTAIGRHWGQSVARMEELDAAGLIHWPKNGGWPRRLDAAPFEPERRMVTIGDVWTDIDRINQSAKERVGYPTQKPIVLLERILSASTPKGAVVLDPFCGCGTTIEAAQKLGRRWIGIDVAYHAVRVIEERVERAFKGTAKYDLNGIPSSYREAVALAKSDRYQFQWWANYLFNPHAVREIKRGADQGIDGELYFPLGPGHSRHGRLLMSVKSGKTVGVAAVREFARVLEREGADMGLFICVDRPTKQMEIEALSMGYAETGQGRKQRLQIVSIQGWFENERPDLPHSPQLQGSTFHKDRRNKSAPKSKDTEQLELTFSIAGQKSEPGVVRHLNPGRVARSA
ncbi:site-specific DNA-methyltransferase [Amorphus coralli]|uniref:site-specific DNA-methyltransferase n=1 Tax=Amorphus coralli TaxID=340680 RepID=UPI00037441E7|nr:site-specific DNA-methyltransferase [Amorphus coralli]